MAPDTDRETTILLVEDDSAIAESVTEGLEERATPSTGSQWARPA